jgi:uncharacterized protein (TIGR02246 family)
MRKSIIGMSLVAASALAACNSVAQQGGGDNPDEVKQAIKASEAKWQADFKAKDLEALAGQYSADASFVTSEGAANGSTEIRKTLANAGTDPAMQIQFASDKVEVAKSGDLAYSTGHFTEQYTDRKTGKVMSGQGTFVSVYKKQDDGSWKMVEDYAVTDPATVKPVPPQKPATRAKMVSF